MKIHLLLVTLAAVSVLVGCSGKSDTAAADTGSAASVQVEAARRQPMERTVTAEATLSPLQQANIVPKISAPVQRFYVNRGDHVRKGQLLALLENRDLVATADESKSLYQQAQAAYQTTTAATMSDDLVKAKSDTESAREALAAAKTVYDNRLALFHQGALAQKLVDDAKVALVQAQAQYDTANEHLKSLQSVGRVEQVKSAQAQVDAAKAHYENAAAQVTYAEVRSPINGVTSDRPLNVGEMAGAGTPLFSIVDISRVVARANIPAQEVSGLQVGQKATISGPGGEITGKITVVSPAVDPSTTTLQVWAEAANPGEKLKLGSTVQVIIDAGQIPDAVAIPASALLASDEGGEKIMVAGSDGLAHEQKVEVGIRSGDDVQIVSGVKPGDQVITQGALGLDDKAKITITKPGEGEGKGSGQSGDEKK